MRREDLLKPDMVSEIVLLGAGTLIYVILVLVLVAASTLIPGVTLTSNLGYS